MLKFSQIKDIGSPDFKAALDIYAEAFPANERHPLNIIKDRVKKGLNIAYIGRLNNKVVFMALLWPLKNTKFILLDYMATSSRQRGKNIGSLFMQEMRASLEKEGKHFIMEIENPEFGDNKEEREKRVAFYRKNGAKELKSVRYILPALQRSKPTEMILMIFPPYKDEKIGVSVVKKLITQIYKELYNRSAKDIFKYTPLF